MNQNDESKRCLEEFRKLRAANIETKEAMERGDILVNHIGSIGPKASAEWIAQIDTWIAGLDEAIAMLESSISR